MKILNTAIPSIYFWLSYVLFHTPDIKGARDRTKRAALFVVGVCLFVCFFIQLIRVMRKPFFFCFFFFCICKILTHPAFILQW